MNREEYIKFYNLKNINRYGYNFTNSFSLCYNEYGFNFIFYIVNDDEYVSLTISNIYNSLYYHTQSYIMNDINDEIIMSVISKYNKHIKRKLFYKYLIYIKKQ